MSAEARFPPLTEELVDRISLVTSAQDYRLRAIGLRTIAKTMHSFGVDGYETHDEEARELERRAADIRRFLKENRDA